MNEVKVNLKGIRNLVTIGDFKDEISLVDILLKTASKKQFKDLLKYKKQLNKELSTYCKFRVSV